MQRAYGMAVGRHVSDRCGSGMVFTACLGAAFAPSRRLGYGRRAPAQTARTSPIRLLALPRLRRRRYASCYAKKNGSWLPLLDVCLRQQRDARTPSLQPRSGEYSSEHKPRKALQAARHASTKTTSTAIVHLGTRPSPRARTDNDRSRKDNETTVDAPASGHVGPTKSKSVRLRAQAREGFWRRPPQRHGHGPGWENCGARCGRSQG